ncbi:MAG: hypothetical protein ABJZ55_00635 [Fuerstiella sp.]
MDDGTDESREPPKQLPAAKPSWFQFAVRMFLTFSILLSFTITTWVRSANRQRTTKAALEEQHVSVMYAHEWKYPPRIPTWNSQVRKFAAKRTDPDYFLPVTVVRTKYLNSRALTSGAKYASADVIDLIAKLNRLQSLSLTHSNVVNSDLMKLSHLTELESLNLHMTKMHEGPIPGLDQLQLKVLYLNRTRIDDQSISALKSMTTLEHLDLTRTKVTDAGLKHLESLPNLRKLILRRTLVTQDGYVAFKESHPTMTVKWESM